MPRILDYALKSKEAILTSLNKRMSRTHWSMNPIRGLDSGSEVDEEGGLGKSSKERSKPDEEGSLTKISKGKYKIDEESGLGKISKKRSKVDGEGGLRKSSKKRSKINEEGGLRKSSKKRNKIDDINDPAFEDQESNNLTPATGIFSKIGSNTSTSQGDDSESSNDYVGTLPNIGLPPLGENSERSRSRKNATMTEEKFMADLREVIYDHSKLEQFMLQAENHPPHVWHKVLLLFCFEKNRVGSTYVNSEIAQQFVDRLVDKFPDILQRVLIRCTRDHAKGSEYSAVHTAILCHQNKIVELLTTVESKARIKLCLIEDAKTPRSDGFQAVHRAVLWSLLRASSEDNLHMDIITKFMSEFEFARRPENAKALESLLVEADFYPTEAWKAALQWASSSGNVHIVRAFKETWPRLFLELHEISKAAGLAPLRVSSLKAKEGTQKGQEEICDLIVDIIDSGDGNFDYIELLAQNLHGKIAHGWTALHLAAASGEDAMVDLLMNCYNKHPIWIKGFEKGKVQHRNRCKDFADDFWMTPLHYAVMGNHKMVVKKLLDWPLFTTQVNAFNLFMRTAIHIASSEQDRASVLEILVDNPMMDLNEADCCSFSALHWAVYGRATNAIRFLLSRATDPERPIRVSDEDIEGRQPFAIAVENKTWHLLMHRPEVKDEVERLYRDRQVYVDAANAILVGSSLIASVTFGQWVDGPTSADKAARVNFIFNSLSFFFSVSSVMAGMGAVLPMEDIYIGKAVASVREWLILSSLLLITCIVFVLGAFVSGGYASLDLTAEHLRNNLHATTIAGTVLCGIVGLSFSWQLYLICRPRSYKFMFLFLGYIARICRNIGRRVAHPMTPSLIYAVEFDVKEEWDVLGRTWKGREKEWRRFRGIHRLGLISVATCRTYALHNEKSSYIKLLAEQRHKEHVGSSMNRTYGGDFDDGLRNEDDKRLEQANTWLRAKLDERSKQRKNTNASLLMTPAQFPWLKLS